MNKSYILNALIQNTLLLVGRNECGNKVTLKASIPISEEWLREIEKAVLRELNQIITVYWEKSKDNSNPAVVDLELDFDAKLPYDRYPLQKLIERRMKK